MDRTLYVDATLAGVSGTLELNFHFFVRTKRIKGSKTFRNIVVHVPNRPVILLWFHALGLKFSRFRTELALT